MVSVDIFSDVICPWCYIGKRRLEKALAALGGRIPVAIHWLPFELNPNMPPEGMERRAYRTNKFGTWEQALALEAQVAAAGQAEGIPFAFERIERTPNTRPAHRLIDLAHREGLQDAVVEALFRAYFTEGRDLSNRGTLIEVVQAAGLDRERLTSFLDGEDGVAEVAAEEAKARRLGVASVPHFLFNGWFAVTGARDPQTLAAALERAAPKT